MALTRTYKSTKYPRLRIGDSIAFMDGTFVTDSAHLQRRIETNDWFNVFIFDVTDKIAHIQANDFSPDELIDDEQEPVNVDEATRLTATKLASLRLTELRRVCDGLNLEYDENHTRNKLILMIKKSVGI